MDPNILIVDDEQHIRLLIEQALEELEDRGVAVRSASNGAEALEMIKMAHPKLVFLDVMMPNMNGFDVCDTLKSELGMQDTYVILLTAKGQEFDRQHGLAVGADMYMTKPFDPDQLVQTALDVCGL
jgi:two-component system alkaline phosphatase synthesis response regulator PhoP